MLFMVLQSLYEYWLLLSPGSLRSKWTSVYGLTSVTSFFTVYCLRKKLGSLLVMCWWKRLMSCFTTLFPPRISHLNFSQGHSWFCTLSPTHCLCVCVLMCFFFFLNRLKGLHMLKWSTESWSVPFGHCCEREVKEKGKDQNCAQNSICNTRGTLWLVFPSRNISLCTFWVSSSFFCPSLLL